jgi:hypothetical protein
MNQKASNPRHNVRPRKYRGPLAADGAAPTRRPAILAWALSGAAHVIVFSALFWPNFASPPAPVEPSAIPITVVPSPAPQPPGPPGPVGPPAPQPAAAPQAIVQPAPKPVARPVSPRLAVAAPLPPVDAAPVDDNSDVLNASQIAGALSADNESGEGGGNNGGGCDTARIVQQALRRDPLVHDAVEDAHREGKAVMLWNGDWVRSGAQDGKGMSAVREAIIWELAFEPAACRNRPVHGLVLLSLADGGTRFAIGAGAWRWSDLLDLQR